MATAYPKEHASALRAKHRLPPGQVCQAQHTRTGTPQFYHVGGPIQVHLLSSLHLQEGTHPPVLEGSKRVAAKDVIFSKGDPATQLVVVVSGKVKVSASSEDGKEITFGILGPGELFGEMALLDGADQIATVTALEPTELAVLERRDFLPVLKTCPAVALELLAILCRRLRQANEVIEDVSFLTLPLRLGKQLYGLANAYGQLTSQGIKIGVHLSQQELANLVGTTRESVNKQLAVWQAEGSVLIENGYLTIRQPAHLAASIRQQVGRIAVQ